jgi:hypothetical protein
MITDFRLQHDPSSEYARDYRVYVEHLRMDVAIGQLRQSKRGLPWVFRFFQSARGESAATMEEALNQILENAAQLLEKDIQRFIRLVDQT